MTKSSANHWLTVAVGLLLVFWAVRLFNLNEFPPFVDEVGHIKFGRDVLAESLLNHSEEGRQFYVWWLIPFGVQSDDHVWTARTASLSLVMIGAAAALALGRMAAGWWGGVFTGLLYIASAYHQFFDRLALADPAAAAFVVAAVSFAYRYRFRVRLDDAMLTGLCLCLAIGFKVTALAYVSIPVLIVILHQRSFRAALHWSATAVSTALVPIGVFFAVLFWRGRNPFMFVQSGSARGLLFETLLNNAQTSVSILISYAGVVAIILLLIGVVILLIRREWLLPAALLVPFALLMLSTRQFSRYLIPVFLLLLINAGIALAHPRFPRVVGLALIAIWAALMWLPFVTTADPINLPLSTYDRAEYITNEASGFGIRETVTVLESVGAQRVLGVLANCLSLQTLASDRFVVECPRLNPNGEDIPALAQLLAENHDAYIVLEAVPYAPDRAPGRLIAQIELRQPSLSVYAP